MPSGAKQGGPKGSVPRGSNLVFLITRSNLGRWCSYFQDMLYGCGCEVYQVWSHNSFWLLSYARSCARKLGLWYPGRRPREGYQGVPSSKNLVFLITPSNLGRWCSYFQEMLYECGCEVYQVWSHTSFWLLSYARSCAWGPKGSGAKRCQAKGG